MYNVLEKLRSGETLTDKERTIHEQGLVSVLKQIHDELDAAVFDAYGWPVTLTDEEILERLVALNAERAAEEARGLIRWLRPDFQNRSQQTQQAIDIEESSDEEAATTQPPAKAKESAKKLPLPKKLPEQVFASASNSRPPANRSPPPTWPNCSPEPKPTHRRTTAIAGHPRQRPPGR